MTLYFSVAHFSDEFAVFCLVAQLAILLFFPLQLLYDSNLSIYPRPYTKHSQTVQIESHRIPPKKWKNLLHSHDIVVNSCIPAQWALIEECISFQYTGLNWWTSSESVMGRLRGLKQLQSSSWSLKGVSGPDALRAAHDQHHHYTRWSSCFITHL